MSKVVWIKLYLGMHDDEKVKLIDAMPNRDSTHYVFIRLLVQAGKTNAGGKIFLNKDIPYTIEMLSIIFNRPQEVIESALNILVSLKMIEMDENNVISIVNWSKYQNIEGMERVRELTRIRVKKHREENKLKEINSAQNCNVTVTKQSKREKENKIKNKNKIKNETEEENGEAETHGEKESEKILMEYLKGQSKKIIGVSTTVIKAAVALHGEKYVKLAIDKALEINKPRMNYINGILKNWQEEGYPESLGNSNNNTFSNEGKNNKRLSFNNFEPRQYDYDALEKELLGWQE